MRQPGARRRALTSSSGRGGRVRARLSKWHLLQKWERAGAQCVAASAVQQKGALQYGGTRSPLASVHYLFD